MENKLKPLYDAENFRMKGHALIDLIADYLQANYDKEIRVNHYSDPDALMEKWNTFLDSKPDFQLFYSKILEDSIHLHHPHYMGHQVSVPSPLSAFGGLVSDLLNNGMAVYEMGAVANVLERKVIELINEAIGYDENSAGFLTSGGTLANLTALLTARRNITKEDIWNEGYQGKKYAVMVCDQAHYCIERAVRIMGLGTDGLIQVPVNDQFQMETSMLEDLYADAQKKGIQIFAIVGSACSTSTGAYDSLEEIGSFARKYNLWFHVDGAHGGAAVFSDKYKYLVKGIAQADSVVIDCHKMMMTPTLATAVVYKRIKDSFSTFQQEAEYLYTKKEDLNWYDTGKRTFECTKLMMGVKVMTLYNEGGPEVFSAYVDHCYNRARNFAELIQKREFFELAVVPEANILCFRIIKPELDIQGNNELNSFIRNSILHEGDFYIVKTTLRGIIYLRTTIMNPFTKASDFENLLQKVEQMAEHVNIDL